MREKKTVHTYVCIYFGIHYSFSIFLNIWKLYSIIFPPEFLYFDIDLSIINLLYCIQILKLV